MAKKTTTSFNLDKTISGIVTPSVFDRIVKEIDAKEIPTAYIDQILVQYYDGNIVELSGKDLTNPIPLDQQSTWSMMDVPFKTMKDVKIFINTDKLEKDVNEAVEKLLGPYC